jgi:hypothetical protein
MEDDLIKKIKYEIKLKKKEKKNEDDLNKK